MRPNIRILEEGIKEKVFVEAMEILEEIGFFVENQEAIEILQEAGLNVDIENRRVKLPPDLVKKSLQSAPSSITLFDREGKEVTKLEGDNICFDPGSAALNVLDSETNRIRTAVTKD
ncbi:MAG: trimethylamine methyltransferase family protein, partial [Candidatus Heimdallarchaeota archaeon]|nr:trimethylamine methyltransferase family protein [Candidatus Heimdallarchaeota archaeon]MCK4878346.1 trimethylamine methyltransferase family protein [Candidatus Heimdallarchaeota archaeon]